MFWTGNATKRDAGWTVYNFHNVLAADTTTTLLFSGYQNPDYHGVDAVSVEASGSVPETASWAMIVGGFGLVGGAMRRRATKTTISFG